MNKPPDGGGGKPPRSTRFPPGKSGNPSGRPRVRRDHASVFHKIMDTKILIMVNGEPHWVDGWGGITWRLRQDGTNGKSPAIKQLMWLLDRLPRPSEPASNLTTEEMNQLLGKYDYAQLQTIREFSEKERALQDQKRKRKV